MNILLIGYGKMGKLIEQNSLKGTLPCFLMDWISLAIGALEEFDCALISAPAAQ